ncbi:Alpha/Beta hydrolase protein [Lineolata rhizophorae]|uniref:Alpha/Beta hydrolase protein n=1 Tax=Lineolata rhizophorae TaxID=578093 RepID=A0A6A6P8Q5_9PEZI|nr:Alpha/Beta hydrolase protein [Lineolata rhizophorae]
MIDHVLGRPSVKFRKIQVFAVVSFWSFYLYKGDRHGPPLLRRVSSLLTPRLTAWQTLVITILWLYIARNFGKLVGLECPEPLANLYSRSYFRATWITTALDAGFWSAMSIRRRWARELASVVFSLYYLVCAEQADDKVRKVRGCLTVDHLRVSWNKGTSPIISSFAALLRPRFMRYSPRAIRIPRPRASAYKEPVHAWLYFDGPVSALKSMDKVVLDIPGGGFVAMTPRNHDDKLLAWAGRTGLPVLSLDYRKAPEYPYPYALNECYDVYHTIVATRGRCIGFSGATVPRIVVSGDSAGGNLAVGMTLMVLESGSTDTRRWHGEKPLPPPEGLVLIYPALDMNIGSWMTDEQMALIRDRRDRKVNEGVLRRKSDDYRKLTPSTPHHSDDEDEDEDKVEGLSGKLSKVDGSAIASSPTAIHISAAHTIDSSATTAAVSAEGGASKSQTIPSPTAAVAQQTSQTTKPQQLRTRLAMSSMISYFNDRILTPEMMRAMIILYVGPHHRPDFSTDYLLSPLLAPEGLLARFPKLHLLTGERDPLVDDTVIFAGRVRQAKRAAWQERRDLGLPPGGADKGKSWFDERDHVEVVLVPGISHGFLQFVSVFPEGWKYIFRCARWLRELFDGVDDPGEPLLQTPAAGTASAAASAAQTPWAEAVGGATATTAATPDGGAGTQDAEEAGGLARPHTPAQRQRHHRRIPTESSIDEDKPLEMTVLRGSRDKARRRGSGSGSGRGNAGSGGGADGAVAVNGVPVARGKRVRRGAAAGSGVGKGASKGERRNRRKSLVSLASEEDLLGRRMRGLTGGLMGGGTGDGMKTP